jgi:hypothetical protein
VDDDRPRSVIAAPWVTSGGAIDRDRRPGCYGVRMRIVGIFAAVALSFASLHAHAESKAWTAAKAGLPAEAKIVVGVDIAAIQKTQLFAAYYPKLLEKADASKLIEALKSTCKLDPIGAVSGVVFATSGDQEDGALYIALSGTDRTKLSSCIPRVVQGMDQSAKVTIKQDGNVTEVFDGKKTAFLGWVGKDVIVAPFHEDDKASLQKWMGGKGALAKSELSKSIAKINTSAMVWGAADATKEIQPGITAKGGYGSIAFAKGNLNADIHAVMANADQATTMANSTKQQLDAVKMFPKLPPGVPEMIKAITITAAGDEVVLKGSFLEKDLMSALTFALENVGGP